MAKIKDLAIPEVQKIGVYAIYNKKNGKYYIGSSVNIFKRMKQQKRAIKSYGLNAKMLEDIIKNDFDFEFLILETFEDGTITDEQLRKTEWNYIKKYNSIKNGYNSSVPFATGKYKGLLKCNVEEKRCAKKHKNNNYDRVSITLPKGTKKQITDKGETVNGLINRLVKEYLENN